MADAYLVAFEDVIHVDAAKVSDERPTSAKQKIKDWFDEASWYAPSMLVIDNIDRMVAAEVEVCSIFDRLKYRADEPSGSTLTRSRPYIWHIPSWAWRARLYQLIL